jgi:hypothetical protein
LLLWKRRFARLFSARRRSLEMPRADIVHFWGGEGLKRWSKDDLRDAAIPEASKSFLVEALPFREDWIMRFDDEALRLPRLPHEPSYRRIGFDRFDPICLDEQRNGCVVEVAEDFGGPERYINTSVELFGEFLVHYQQYRLIARATEDDVSDVVAATERRMRKADAAAFDGVDDYWWPLIIEQMRDGLL